MLRSSSITGEDGAHLKKASHMVMWRDKVRLDVLMAWVQKSGSCWEEAEEAFWSQWIPGISNTQGT